MVGADAGAVYAALADISTRPTWLPELRRVEAPDAPATKGTRFVGETSILGHRFLGTSEVVEAEPVRVLAEEVYLGARMTSTWTLTPTADGTRVAHRIEIDFPSGPFGRIERWVLRRRLVRMQRSSLAGLADLLGQPPPIS